MFAMKTIRQGERAAVWSRDGKVTLVDGPQRLMLWDRTIELLTRHTADPNQYLIIQFKDGHTEHQRGPAAVWFDPVEHAEISVKSAVTIDANEAIVVYHQHEGRVDRRVVRGPELYVPSANEWLHRFSWHGADPKNARRKVPHALQFTKLRIIPDQMYFDVEEVRTADDALVCVKLMIFFELADIERMLDQTHDPVADFINAVTADVINFTAALTFEQFKEQTERLSELATYPQLAERAGRIGYRIGTVVYRGYHASDKLQAMHDSAIETRTRLRLESETEEQAQTLADFKLTKERERAAQKQDMEQSAVQHQNALKRLAHDESARQQQVDWQRELENTRKTNELEVAHQQALNAERVAFLQKMQALDIDLTRYLVAQYQHPDRVIRIDGSERPQLHVHEN